MSNKEQAKVAAFADWARTRRDSREQDASELRAAMEGLSLALDWALDCADEWAAYNKQFEEDGDGAAPRNVGVLWTSSRESVMALREHLRQVLSQRQ